MKVLKPAHHKIIPEWMSAATDREKESILLLADIAEPQLFRSVGRPQIYGGEPPVVEHGWYAKKLSFATPVAPYRWPVREREGKGDHLPQPGFAYYGEPTPIPADPELKDLENISKPGGFLLKMIDSVDLQRKKNEERNKGTYKLFSGKGTYTTI